MSLLSLPKSLWVMIDEHLLSLVTAWAGTYTELGSAEIVVAEQFDPDNVKMPFILIRGYERKLEQAEPVIGDGEYHLDGVIYPYEILTMAQFDTISQAKNFAANANASLTDVLRADPTLGGMRAANGEYVKFFDFDDSELFVRGLAGQAPNRGSYSGTAVLRLEIHTEI